MPACHSRVGGNPAQFTRRKGRERSERGMPKRGHPLRARFACTRPPRFAKGRKDNIRRMTSSPTSTSRVVIVGGGIIGCMTAYYLTRAGVSDVVVVEREGVASGASGYSAGMLTPYSGSNDPGLLALSGASLKLHAELAEELPAVTGIDHGYDMVPYLRCTFEESGYNEARKFMDDRVADGLDAVWLTGNEARSVCDWLSDEVEGACLTSIEPSVDSRLLTQSVLKAAEMGGARLVDGEVVGVLPHDGVSPSPQPSPIEGEGEHRERESRNSPSPAWERAKERGAKWRSPRRWIEY